MKLFVQASAEEDILRQVEWYASQGATDVGRRFYLSVSASLETLMANPGFGAPKKNRQPPTARFADLACKGV